MTARYPDFFVGTFSHPCIYRCRFDHESNDLKIVEKSKAVGNHSWLALSPSKKHLYGTVWSGPPSPPSVAAYLIDNGDLKPLSNVPVRSQSGYVWATGTHFYTCGGPTGEVFKINADGSLGDLVQELNFVDDTENMSKKRGDVPHGDFGGLRHGSHSFDVSPDGSLVYIADIGRNCVWIYAVQGHGANQHLALAEKKVSPREGDGPRHVWPHPDGKVIYVVQEHSSIVDLFEVHGKGVATRLKHIQGVSIIPTDKSAKLFWADEVRVSRPPTGKPRYLYASTRGLEKDTMGYVTTFKLDENGLVEGGDGAVPLDIYETSTSGGIANAVEPAPMLSADDSLEYVALTDSEEGWVFMLSFDGQKIKEVARVATRDDTGGTVKAATAVWL